MARMTRDPKHESWLANDWYCEWEGSMHDLVQNAEKAYSSSGLVQVIHKHAHEVNGTKITGLHTEICGLANCIQVGEI